MKRRVEYIDPFIGTDESSVPTVWESNGGTYPGAALPFGMFQVTPEAYRFQDKQIRAFSLIHHTSGYPKGSSGNLFIMPTSREYLDLNTGRAVRLDHSREEASAGMYRVELPEPDIDVKATVSPRGAMFQIDFRGGDGIFIIDDAASCTLVGNCCLEIFSHGCFCVMELSSPVSGLFREGSRWKVVLKTPHAPVVSIRACGSYTDFINAEKNLQKEIDHWDFDKLYNEAKDAWDEVLSQIELSGSSDDEKVLLYTALYHSYLDPHLKSDVGEADCFSGVSPWDTFRTKLPLLVLLQNENISSFVNSELGAYDRQGFLPPGPMTGNHMVPIIADCYFKNYQGIDYHRAYKAIRATLTELPYGRSETAIYDRLGYVPSEINYSVTKTLEFAYNDWAAGRMAQELGYEDDAIFFINRSFSYRKLFNPDTFFMSALSEDGIWEKEGFQEGDAWTYSWFVPHNIQDLINLMGGDENYLNQLDLCFSENHYCHDNEPPLHYTFLFHFAGRPDLSRHWTTFIRKRDYSSRPGGLPGNDDLGALSAWYVFATLGLFPFCPGAPDYLLSGPAVKKAVVKVPGGGLVILGHGPLENSYIQKVFWDGDEWHKPFISHSQLMKGGTLEFYLGDTPSDWGRFVRPYSITGEPAEIELKEVKCSSETILSGDPVELNLFLENKRDLPGTLIVPLSIDRAFKKNLHLFSTGSGTRIETVVETLFGQGSHVLQIGDLAPAVIDILPSPGRLKYLKCRFPSPPIIDVREECFLSLNLQNQGGKKETFSLPVFCDDEIMYKESITLDPGELIDLDVKLICKTGIHTYRIGDSEDVILRGYPRGKSVPEDPDPVSIFLYGRESGTITDIMGRADVQVHGLLENAPVEIGPFQGFRTNGTEGNYVEILSQPLLDSMKGASEMTFSLWIYPDDEENFADIITQGNDHTVVQVRAANQAVNFYHQTWQAGEAYGKVPAGWNRNWHHVTCVADEKSRKLYIDGELTAHKDREPFDFSTAMETPWFIGYNQDCPERHFKGYIGEVRFYDMALSPEQISSGLLNFIEHNSGEVD